MRRLAAILALVLGLTLLAAPPASAAVAAHAENRASGSAAGLTTLIGIEKRLSAEAVRENAGLDYDIASDDAVAARAIPPGSFNLINWAKYPSWAPKPTGTLRVLSGAEYDAARKAANAANAALRRADPAAYAGKQIHEIIPVKFGGSPTDIANKMAVTPGQHAELTNFWNQLMRDLP